MSLRKPTPAPEQLLRSVHKVTSAMWVKATSHSTIFDMPMRPLREDQQRRHRFTR